MDPPLTAWSVCSMSLFFFNDTATTEIYTLSLHDALPISLFLTCVPRASATWTVYFIGIPDRKSTRLNSSHANISYAVFCLKKKPKRKPITSSSRPLYRERIPPQSHGGRKMSYHCLRDRRWNLGGGRKQVRVLYFFFNDRAPTETSPLPLPAALPI